MHQARASIVTTDFKRAKDANDLGIAIAGGSPDVTFDAITKHGSITFVEFASRQDIFNKYIAAVTPETSYYMSATEVEISNAQFGDALKRITAVMPATALKRIFERRPIMVCPDIDETCILQYMHPMKLQSGEGILLSLLSNAMSRQRDGSLWPAESEAAAQRVAIKERCFIGHDGLLYMAIGDGRLAVALTPAQLAILYDVELMHIKEVACRYAGVPLPTAQQVTPYLAGEWHTATGMPDSTRKVDAVLDLIKRETGSAPDAVTVTLCRRMLAHLFPLAIGSELAKGTVPLGPTNQTGHLVVLPDNMPADACQDTIEQVTTALKQSGIGTAITVQNIVKLICSFADKPDELSKFIDKGMYLFNVATPVSLSHGGTLLLMTRCVKAGGGPVKCKFTPGVDLFYPPTANNRDNYAFALSVLFHTHTVMCKERAAALNDWVELNGAKEDAKGEKSMGCVVARFQLAMLFSAAYNAWHGLHIDIDQLLCDFYADEMMPARINKKATTDAPLPGPWQAAGWHHARRRPECTTEILVFKDGDTAPEFSLMQSASPCRAFALLKMASENVAKASKAPPAAEQPPAVAEPKKDSKNKAPKEPRKRVAFATGLDEPADAMEEEVEMSAPVAIPPAAPAAKPKKPRGPRAKRLKAAQEADAPVPDQPAAPGLIVSVYDSAAPPPAPTTHDGATTPLPTVASHDDVVTPPPAAVRGENGVPPPQPVPLPEWAQQAPVPIPVGRRGRQPKTATVAAAQQQPSVPAATSIMQAATSTGLDVNAFLRVMEMMLSQQAGPSK